MDRDNISMQVPNNLKQILRDKGITLKSVLKNIGMNEQSYYTAIKSNTLRISHLFAIAQYLNIPISYFFGEKPSGGNIIQNTGVVNGSHINIQQTIAHNKELAHENELLREKVKALEKQIDLLNQMIEILKNQNK